MGDEVKTASGTRFEISQLWKRTDGSFAYSDPVRRWYSAEDLRLVNRKPLSPMSITYNYTPDDCEHGTFQASCPCGRKAETDPELGEELKIGDWVKTISGTIFRIGDIYPFVDGSASVWVSKDGGVQYPSHCLRKLAPEEIAKHLAPPTNTPQNQFNEKTDARLSATEKQLKEFDGEISHLMGSIQECLMESGDVEARTRCREMAIEKRLDFVEKFQRDQTRDAPTRAGWQDHELNPHSRNGHVNR
jgi:hypothetical protein